MLRGASSVAGFLLAFLVGGHAHSARQKHLLRAAADCQMVNIPASEVRATHAAFLETEPKWPEATLRPETINFKYAAVGGGSSIDSGSGSEEMGFDGNDWVPLKQQNGKPFNVVEPMNKVSPPLKPEPSLPGQVSAPHAKVSVKPCDGEPECQGTPEPLTDTLKDPSDKAAGGPQIMFSDNDMDLMSQRMYAVSIQRVLNNFDAENATCYCHFTDKARTQLDFSEMNCLCKNRPDRPLCRLEEIWAKYEHADLEGVITEARTHTTPEQEKFLDTNGTDMSLKFDGTDAKPGANGASVCSIKPCKNMCMSKGVCLCSKCICEPGLSGEDCGAGLPKDMVETASQKQGTSPPVKAPIGKLDDYNLKDRLVNILPNPLLHATSSNFKGRRRLLAAASHK